MLPHFLAVAALSAPPVDSSAVVAPIEARRPDPLFPGSGRVSMSVGTGIPLVAVGEVAVGIGDHVALGAMGGATPGIPAFGLRPRIAIGPSEGLRGVITAPLLFYPFGFEPIPWFLTRPSVVVEYGSSSGVRVGAGVGLAVVTSIATLRGEKRATPYGGPSFDKGLWNTVNATFAMPIGRTTSVFVDAALILKGVRPADDWVGVGGPPMTIQAGLNAVVF